MLTLNQWQQRAKNVEFPSQAFINGQLQPALSGSTFACISPIDGQVLCQVSACNTDDVNLAVANARAVFDRGDWSAQSPSERKRCLLKWAQLIEQNRAELALLETLDMGKPINDAWSIDVPEAADAIAWNAEAIDKIYGEVAPTQSDTLALITREPLGVVGAIVPWNFPMTMACWKLGPALAAGNSVILKPSEKSPLSAIRLAQLAVAAGLPAGVFNVIPGFGSEAGQPLAEHPEVDGLAFTGSTAVGKHLLAVGATSNMKRTFVECGGKSANIVFDDCVDLDQVAQAATMAAFFNQGEVCSAGSRLLVQENIAEQFIDSVIKASQSIIVGNPLDPQTQLGAIVDSAQLDSIKGYIELGQNEGAHLRWGGQQIQVDSQGYYLKPAIFDRVTPQMTINQEEIFGPVLCCQTFATDAEAVSLANNSQYGLGAGIWSSNLSRCHRLAQQLRSGSVWVNCYDQGDMTVPFGGYKQSGTGRDKSLHAFDKYTELKTTWIAL